MQVTIGTLCLLCASISPLAAQSPVQAVARRPTTPPVWHPKLERFTPAGALQTEFGSPLSETGYRKLLAALPWKAPSGRVDYYFDAYDGHQSLPRTGGMPLK